MSKEAEKKRLYSFYIDPDRLDRLNRLAGFLSVKDGKRVTVSALINTAIEDFTDRNQDTLDAMERLSEEVFRQSSKQYEEE